MTTYKHLTSHTKDENIDRVNNDPDYKFKVRVFDNGQIIELDVTQVKLWDKNYAKQFNPSLRDGGDEWDSDLIELGQDKEYIRKATPVILNALENPDFIWTKDPGKDRAGKARPLQQKEVKGKRQVLFDLHEDAAGGHLHLKLFRYAIDEENKTAVDAPMYVADVQRAILNQINKELIENGLAPVGSIQNVIPQGNQKTSQETKIQAEEILAIDGEKVETTLNTIIDDVQYNDSAIDVALKSDLLELQKIIESAKTKQAEILQKKKALEVVNENRALHYKVKELSQELEETKTIVEKDKQDIEQLKDKLDIKTEEILVANTYRITLEDSIKEQQTAIAELEQFNSELEIEVKQQNEVITSLTDENNLYIEQLKIVPVLKDRLQVADDKLESLLESSKLKDENIKLKDERIKDLEDRYKALEQRAKQIEEQQAAIIKQNDEITKENSILKQFVKAVEIRLEQASTIISTLADKIKESASKTFLHSFAEETRRIEELHKSLDNSTSANADKIRQLQEQFHKKSAEVNKFVEDSKNEQSTSPKKR